MEEGVSLYVEEISANSDVTMIVEDGRWKGNGFERWDVRSSVRLGRGSFVESNVAAINGKGAECICRSHGAVSNEIVA